MDHSGTAAATEPTAAALAALTDLLAREREALEVLRAAAERLRLTEVLRAAEAEVLADHLHLASASTLAELVDAVPEPWRSVLREHGAHLRNALTELSRSGAGVDQLSLQQFLR